MIFNNLTNRVTLIIAIAFFLSNIGIIQKILFKKDLKNSEIIFLSIIFGGMGIIGTYTGIRVDGAIANARVIGVFVGGLIGGPKVGLLSGVIAGSHRYLSDMGGFTALSCSISTVLEGLMAGALSKRFKDSNHKITFALFSGMLAEVMQMVIILLISKPHYRALELVKVIGMPMIIANAFGICIFVALADNIYKEVAKESAYQAQIALRIADETLKYFRRGYNKDTAEAIARIIIKHVDIDAVAFTDKEKILAHVGEGDDHHKYGSPLQTKITKNVIEGGNYRVAHTKRAISCNNDFCPLKSAIIVPLKDRDEVMGCLKLYKTRESGITVVETELALGLAQIFSTQLELSKIDIQNELLTKSELKALQAQINPHFLFNAINTIGSLIRINPEEARSLLIHLGNYFRNNLSSSYADVSLKKEIENVNSYVEIEKARFGEKLEIIYNIPEDLECELPPLIIQPIVENAIKHGIFNKLEGGVVEIKASSFGKNINIVVKDDGVGMDSNTLKSLFEDNGEDKIGVKNVNERLKNKYGSDYGLQIKSKVDVGTEVKIIIPK